MISFIICTPLGRIIGYYFLFVAMCGFSALVARHYRRKTK